MPSTALHPEQPLAESACRPASQCPVPGMEPTSRSDPKRTHRESASREKCTSGRPRFRVIRTARNARRRRLACPVQGFAQGFPACTKLRRAFSSVAQSGGPLSRRSVVQVHERPPTRLAESRLGPSRFGGSGAVSATFDQARIHCPILGRNVHEPSSQRRTYREWR